jgi:hypothetical protein
MKLYKEQNIVKPETNAHRIPFQIKNSHYPGTRRLDWTLCWSERFENRNLKKKPTIGTHP